MRYEIAFVATGVLLGVLWPLGRRSRRTRAGVGAAVGALFASLAVPAMRAALPNWPVPSVPSVGPHAWATNLVAGAVLGVLLGWGFPLRNPKSRGAPFITPTA